MNTKRDWLMLFAGAFWGMSGAAGSEGGWFGLALFFAAGLACRLKAGEDKGHGA
jgi:4-hydroxybenzoate polyprenyltransferase